MKKYETPEIIINTFLTDEVVCGSSVEPTKITGGGGGIVLPDDDWTV